MRNMASVPGQYARSAAKKCSNGGFYYLILTQKSLLEETGDQDLVVHALLDNRQPSCLADDDVSPLHDDNGCEKHGVACKFDDFALRESPLLTVRVLD